MKTSATSIGVVASIVSGAVAAQAVDFEADAVGAPPVGWTCGVTGRGTPHWQVEDDPGAPSARHVLQQTGSGAPLRLATCSDSRDQRFVARR